MPKMPANANSVAESVKDMPAFDFWLFEECSEVELSGDDLLGRSLCVDG